MPDPSALILYAKLGRPPREGELYCYPHAPTEDSRDRVYRLERCVPVNSGMYALTPIPAAEALERLSILCRKAAAVGVGGPMPTHEDILAALLGPADEPTEDEVERWRECAEAWEGTRSPGNPRLAADLARHIARFAPGGES